MSIKLDKLNVMKSLSLIFSVDNESRIWINKKIDGSKHRMFAIVFSFNIVWEY